MYSYFRSCHSDNDETAPDSFGIEFECSKPESPESQMLLKIIMLALDDLTSRKRIHRVSAVLFFESGVFKYYLHLLGIDEVSNSLICDHLSEVVEHVRSETGMCAKHDEAWVMERLNREYRPREGTVSMRKDVGVNSPLIQEDALETVYVA